MESVNIAAPHESRKNEAGNRTIKLALTDGKQTVFGLEYSRCNDLNVDMVPGCKVGGFVLVLETSRSTLHL